MIIFNGKIGKIAKVMIDNIDEATAKQIQSIVNHPVLNESPVMRLVTRYMCCID